MDDLDTAIVLIPLLAVLAPVAARAMGAWIRVPVVVHAHDPRSGESVQMLANACERDAERGRELVR